MNIRFVKTYLKKCNNQLHIAHSQDNVSMLWLWCDSVWSLLRYGCTVTEYVQCGFYKMRSFERIRIVTFPKFRKLVKLNDPKYIPILRDKDKFNSFFAPFVHRDWLASSKMTFDEFTSFCQKHSQIVLKPLDGTEGHGVSIITPPSKENDKLQALFNKLCNQNILIEERIQQHPRMVFSNSSVNTIRVMTIMDKNTHDVVVFRTDLRAGIGNSVIDNFNNGGCAYQIDIETGRIISFGSRYGKGNEHILFHPGTSTCMLGYQIPNWQQVIDSCKEAHKMLPQCRYISWDVAITEDDIELIEGNHDGDYDLLEFFGQHGYWPLLKKYL